MFLRLSVSIRCPLHHLDLLRRQPVQLVDQPVNLPVRHLDPPLERGLLVRHALRGEPRVQIEHLRDGHDQAVGARRVGEVGEGDTGA